MITRQYAYSRASMNGTHPKERVARRQEEEDEQKVEKALSDEEGVGH